MLTYVEDRFVEDLNSNHLIEDRSNLNHNSNPQPGNYDYDHMDSNH